jgi:glyoxylase-like metal-dependent hydrolase (beta-lactamase superfamily II)
MQVTDYIHALKVPFHVTTPQGKIPRFVYVYLIYGEQICLIDSGVATSEKIIFDYMKKTGRSPEDISLLLLTHSHPDHIGAAQAVKRASGCKVAAHTAEIAWIEDVDLQARERPVPGFNLLVGGSVKVDHPLQDGDVLDLGDGLDLLVIHTPGHSRGSISLWLPEEKALFSADAVPIVGDLPIYDDVLESARSIKRLRALEGIEFLLASWDDPRRGERAYQTMDGGLIYLQRIHEAVKKVEGDSRDLEPMELCHQVLKELGLPETIANPLVARSFQASLAVRGNRVLPWD